MWLIDLSNNFLNAISSGWNTILDWLNATLSDVLEPITSVPIVGGILDGVLKDITININGSNINIMSITILQLIFGIGVPLFLGFMLVKWLLNLVT